MQLAPNEHEQEIVNAAEAYLRKALPISRLHKPGGVDLNGAARSDLAGLGWFGLTLPEEQGGIGLSAVEHVLFFREAGRQCAPLDVLAQVLASMVAAGSEYGPGFVAGETATALAVVDGEHYRLIGAPHASHGVCATPNSAFVFELASLAREPRLSLDPSNSLARIPNAVHPVAEMHGSAVWLMAQLGTAAMLLGVAEAAMDLIVEYAKVRETFGRKIGSYQAVRHPCADMAVRNEATRCQLYYAATALKASLPDAPAHIAAAKHLADEAAVKNADQTIQLHGGIGITDDHDAHLLLKRALVLSRIFGDRRQLLGQLLHAKLEA